MIYFLPPFPYCSGSIFRSNKSNSIYSQLSPVIQTKVFTCLFLPCHLWKTCLTRLKARPIQQTTCTQCRFSEKAVSRYTWVGLEQPMSFYQRGFHPVACPCWHQPPVLKTLRGTQRLVFLFYIRGIHTPRPTNSIKVLKSSLKQQ